MSPAIPFAVLAKGRPCCIGPTIVGRFEAEVGIHLLRPDCQSAPHPKIDRHDKLLMHPKLDESRFFACSQSGQYAVTPPELQGVLILFQGLEFCIQLIDFVLGADLLGYVVLNAKKVDYLTMIVEKRCDVELVIKQVSVLAVIS